MRTRFWIALLACATLVPAAGCGSCRWGRKHGVLPYQCVDPHCDDPACEVCSPVPPLYDGWGMHRCMRRSGCNCGCGSMASGGMPCGDVCESCGDCGMMMGECGPCGGCADGMVMDGSCEMTGNSCGMPMFSDGGLCPHCHQSLAMPPQEPTPATPQQLESAPPYQPGPAAAPANPMGQPAETNDRSALFSPQPGSYPETIPAVPVPNPTTIPSESLAPEPPVATPTTGTLPSNYFYAPNKPLSMGKAPKPVTGPVHLAPPPAQWETSLEVRSLEQASMSLPALP